LAPSPISGLNRLITDLGISHLGADGLSLLGLGLLGLGRPGEFPLEDLACHKPAILVGSVTITVGIELVLAVGEDG
jgi:hypothetical protein